MNRFQHLSRIAYHYIKKSVVLPYPPYFYTIEPTNICNFACSFCPQSDPKHKFEREQGYLSVENYKLFLKKRNALSPGNRNSSLTLDGEPLLNPNFVELVAITNEFGLTPRFSSNARLLYPRVIDELVKAGGFSISVDFAAKKEIFEQIRGKKGDFEPVYENLKYLVEVARKNPKVKVEIVDISTFAGTEEKSSLREMRSLFPEHLTRNIKFYTREFHNFTGHLNFEKGKRYRLCPYPWTMLAVTWDGNAVACCRDTSARTILGNVFEDEIMNIWNGERYQQMRLALIEQRTQDVAACRSCDLPYSPDNKRWNPMYIIKSILSR